MINMTLVNTDCIVLLDLNDNELTILANLLQIPFRKSFLNSKCRYPHLWFYENQVYSITYNGTYEYDCQIEGTLAEILQLSTDPSFTVSVQESTTYCASDLLKEHSS
jgi:hypothetical protein